MLCLGTFLKSTTFFRQNPDLLGDWTEPSSMRISSSGFRDDFGYFTITIEVLDNVLSRWGVHSQCHFRGIDVDRGEGYFAHCWHRIFGGSVIGLPNSVHSANISREKASFHNSFETIALMFHSMSFSKGYTSVEFITDCQELNQQMVECVQRIRTLSRTKGQLGT